MKPFSNIRSFLKTPAPQFPCFYTYLCLSLSLSRSYPMAPSDLPSSLSNRKRSFSISEDLPFSPPHKLHISSSFHFLNDYLENSPESPHLLDDHRYRHRLTEIMQSLEKAIGTMPDTIASCSNDASKEGRTLIPSIHEGQTLLSSTNNEVWYGDTLLSRHSGEGTLVSNGVQGLCSEEPNLISGPTWDAGAELWSEEEEDLLCTLMEGDVSQAKGCIGMEPCGGGASYYWDRLDIHPLMSFWPEDDGSLLGRA